MGWSSFLVLAVEPRDARGVVAFVFEEVGVGARLVPLVLVGGVFAE